MHQSLVSTVNCAEQIPESRASNLVSFAMFVRKVIVIQILKLMPESSNYLVSSVMRFVCWRSSRDETRDIGELEELGKETREERKPGI